MFDDPIDLLVDIAATWEKTFRKYATEGDGRAIAEQEYLKWLEKNSENSPKATDEDVKSLREQDMRRLASTDGAFATRLLYGWYKMDRGTRFYDEPTVLARLQKSLGGPDRSSKTMSRLVQAMARLGIVKRVPGIRGRNTVLKLSDEGAALYKTFCRATGMSVKTKAA